MQRIPPTFPQFFSLLVLLGILGLLQTASAQNSSRPQSATQEADTATEPSDIGRPPLAVPIHSCLHPSEESDAGPDRNGATFTPPLIPPQADKFLQGE